jgi:hypothetical protein
MAVLSYRHLKKVPQSLLGGGIHSSNYVEMPHWTLSTCGREVRKRRRQGRGKMRYAVLPGDVGRSRPREREEEADLGISGDKRTPSMVRLAGPGFCSYGKDERSWSTTTEGEDTPGNGEVQPRLAGREKSSQSGRRGTRIRKR